MEINILSFGKIAEFITINRLDTDEIFDTDGLKQQLEKTYPQLKEIKYKLALNKQIVQKNIELLPGDVVAIMPPFSGG
ncbi:MoaD/ThiS family protein [Pedobacter jejuensis]|uniref:Molybdopterin synthase sulfur carrier subunit n=1 Tax=Pedobacter jejuensis TaxID=1268550 RepID=A0A3N0C0N9_9SPHI|nr:MoaD/ThiS family protein [Pedobacter jejuensis]RNL55773.1 molybdopterin synthase sulfur carrier subunit [Pedobacter jejuensis]